MNRPRLPYDLTRHVRLDFATKNRKFAVATLDSDLLKRLRMADVTTITLSKNKMIIANRYFEG